MRPLTKEQLDDAHRERLTKEMEIAGDETGFAVGSIIDCFGDGKLVHCSKCGIPLFMRPWLLEIVKQHSGIKIMCQFCVDPEWLRGTIIRDVAAIMEKEEPGNHEP
jgi:hypothetical protein